MATKNAPCPYCRTNLCLKLASHDFCSYCHTKFYYTESGNFQSIKKLPIINKQKNLGIFTLALAAIAIYLRTESFLIISGLLSIIVGTLIIYNYTISLKVIKKYGFFDVWYILDGDGNWGPYLKRDKYFNLHKSLLVLEALIGLIIIGFGIALLFLKE